MFLRRLIFFGYPLAEILVLWGVAALVGWPIALILLIAGFPAGAALLRNAAARSAALRSAPIPERPKIAQSAMGLFLSGILIIIPGFITDVIGVLMLIPPIHRWLLRFVGTWLEARMLRVPGFAAFTPGDVIQGTVIVEDITEDIAEDTAEEKDEGPGGPSSEIGR